MKNLIAKNLASHLKKNLPSHKMSEVYLYATLPPGKLFRPLLAASIFSDFSNTNVKKVLENEKSSLSLLCSALEIHHAYTLIHDDLPSMDNDDFRRGKESVHKKFGEWKAILAGDGLLNLSYQLVGAIKSTELPLILKVFSWSLGAKGLIQGQVLDLAEEMNLSFDTLLETHKLKTGRLIQMSLLSGILSIKDDQQLFTSTDRYRLMIDLAKVGESIGIIFQLLDDFVELLDSELNLHEVSINPWPKSPLLCHTQIEKDIKKIREVCEKYPLKSLKNILHHYFESVIKKLKASKTSKYIEKYHVEKIMENLERFNLKTLKT